jgi:hypothetical protein
MLNTVGFSLELPLLPLEALIASCWLKSQSYLHSSIVFRIEAETIESGSLLVHRSAVPEVSFGAGPRNCVQALLSQFDKLR